MNPAELQNVIVSVEDAHFWADAAAARIPGAAHHARKLAEAVALLRGEPSLPTPEPPPMIVSGPLTFGFEPDGDDPGSGWIDVSLRGSGHVSLQATRRQWDEFAAALFGTDA